MKYFNECKTIEQVKSLYKQLAKNHHPDCGGNTAIMQEINAEYDLACRTILNEHYNLSEDEINKEADISERYRLVIDKLVVLPYINIEIIGNWIWVTGQTYEVRQLLKEAGLFYASKKVAWYYRAEEYKTAASNKTIDEIREKYGSQTIRTGNPKAIGHEQ